MYVNIFLYRLFINQFLSCWLRFKNRYYGLIGEEALNNVFELFRNHFSYKDENELFSVGTVNTAKKFLSICYQRRCCCVHHGNCFTNDPNIRLQDKDFMCRCKENNYTDTLFQSKYDDSILIKLETFIYLEKS